MNVSPSSQTWLSNATSLPKRFVAAQLRRPSGRFGRWVVTRTLNVGNAELIKDTLDALALQRNDTFLDVGFGGGRAIALAASRTEGPLWGIDYSGDMVVAAVRTFEPLVRSGRLNLLCADAADVPLRAAIADAICSTNTLYFWSDPVRTLAALRACLKPGGRLALGYSGAEKMRRYEDITRHGFRLYDPGHVEPLLAQAGFGHFRTITLSGRFTRGDFVSIANA